MWPLTPFSLFHKKRACLAAALGSSEAISPRRPLLLAVLLRLAQPCFGPVVESNPDNPAHLSVLKPRLFRECYDIASLSFSFGRSGRGTTQCTAGISADMS